MRFKIIRIPIFYTTFNMLAEKLVKIISANSSQDAIESFNATEIEEIPPMSREMAPGVEMRSEAHHRHSGFLIIRETSPYFNIEYSFEDFYDPDEVPQRMIEPFMNRLK